MRICADCSGSESASLQAHQPCQHAVSNTGFWPGCSNGAFCKQMIAQLAGDARAGSPRASAAAVPSALSDPAAAGDPGAPPSAEPPGACESAAAAPPAAALAAGGSEPAAGGGAQGGGSAREQDAADEVAVARFLRSTPGLSRQLVRRPCPESHQSGCSSVEGKPRCLASLPWWASSVLRILHDCRIAVPLQCVWTRSGTHHQLVRE